MNYLFTIDVFDECVICHDHSFDNNAITIPHLPSNLFPHTAHTISKIYKKAYIEIQTSCKYIRRITKETNYSHSKIPNGNKTFNISCEYIVSGIKYHLYIYSTSCSKIILWFFDLLSNFIPFLIYFVSTRKKKMKKEHIDIVQKTEQITSHWLYLFHLDILLRFKGFFILSTKNKKE